MPKLRVDDIQIYYEVKGEGFPLVMINGLSDNLDCWDPRLVNALSEKFKLVLFDNRDMGRTGSSEKEYGMKLFADDTAGLMNALGIPTADVLGISMGGMIAQELVLGYPEKVARLVLCSTGCDWCFSQEASKIVLGLDKIPKEELLGILLSLKGANDFPVDFVKKLPAVVMVFTSDFVKENPDLAKHPFEQAAKNPLSPGGWRRQLNAMQGFRTCGRLQKINVPTLVLHGLKDVEIPPENGSVLANAIPGAKLVYLEKSAHYLAEEMSELVHVLRDFLA